MTAHARYIDMLNNQCSHLVRIGRWYGIDREYINWYKQVSRQYLSYNGACTSYLVSNTSTLQLHIYLQVHITRFPFSFPIQAETLQLIVLNPDPSLAVPLAQDLVQWVDHYGGIILNHPKADPAQQDGDQAKEAHQSANEGEEAHPNLGPLEQPQRLRQMFTKKGQ